MHKTHFEGQLYFGTPGGELTTKQLAKLKNILENSAKQNPNWEHQTDYVGYFNFALADDFSGIQWAGEEKSDFIFEQVNTITKFMRENIPDFRFKGQLLAQGEDPKDRWLLIVGEDGRAVRQEIIFDSNPVCCPNCSFEFFIEKEEK